MTRQYKYAREKLGHAVYILAIGEGDVRSRLRRTHRHIRMLGTHNLPVDLHEELQWVKYSMTKYGALKDRYGPVLNALEHTMRRIRNTTGKKIAEKIWSMNLSLQQR